MIIIITGGTGFIGKNLLKQIDKDKNKIYVISRKIYKNSKSVKFIKSNLNQISKKRNQLEKIKPDLLIHLAWEGIPNYDFSTSIKNYKDQIKFFNCLKHIKSLKHIIITGTCAEYNAIKGELRENYNGKQKDNFLSNSKTKIYKHIKKIFSRNIKITWLRLFYVYGKFQRKNALIPYLIDSVRKNKKIILNSPHDAKDFINVTDVCSAILLFIKLKKPGIFNVGTGKSYNPFEILNIIRRKHRSKVKLFYNKKSERTNITADIKKINKLGWKPKHSLKKYIESIFI